MSNLAFVDKTLIFQLSIKGENPVPWSTPFVARNGGRIKDRRLVAWQKRIKEAVIHDHPSIIPTTKPLALHVVFYIEAAKGCKPGQIAAPSFTWNENHAQYKLKGKAPDLTNLIKSLEDALEGVVFINDAQVRLQRSSAYWSLTPGFDCDIYEIIE